MFPRDYQQLAKQPAAKQSFLTKHWQALSALAIGVCITLFGDAFVFGVLHLMHIPLGYAELLLELFFAQAFGLSHHAAEIATAYTGLFVVVVLGVKVTAKTIGIARSAHRWLQTSVCSLRQTVQSHEVWRYRSWVIAGSCALCSMYFLMG